MVLIFFFFKTNWQRRVQGVIKTRLLTLRAIPTLLFTSYRDQTNVLTSVNLSFFIYKMGIIMLLILLPQQGLIFSSKGGAVGVRKVGNGGS